MITGVVVLNRTYVIHVERGEVSALHSYSLREYIAALVLILGTIEFTLGDVEVSPKFHTVGTT